MNILYHIHILKIEFLTKMILFYFIFFLIREKEKTSKKSGFWYDLDILKCYLTRIFYFT